jgi:ribosomal protein S25
VTVEEKVDQFEEMWKRVDKVTDNFFSSHRPLNSFTTAEFAKRRKIHPASAQRILRRLVKAGEVIQHGKSGSRYSYYVLAERQVPIECPNN